MDFMSTLNLREDIDAKWKGERGASEFGSARTGHSTRTHILMVDPGMESLHQIRVGQGIHQDIYSSMGKSDGMRDKKKDTDMNTSRLMGSL
ncbi:hypothetical protein PAXRUDRAFT_832629, partial [Paxillus rubicundulus Ve08.2h10]